LNCYEIRLIPEAGFATPLKGDTVFGHFCWQAAHDPDLIEGGLDRAMERYGESPFAVFSSGFPVLAEAEPVYLMKRPDMPLERLFNIDRTDCRKALETLSELKERRWMEVGPDWTIDLAETAFFSDDDLRTRLMAQSSADVRRQLIRAGAMGGVQTKFSQPHNTINRLTMTTGTGPFAPFNQDASYYHPGLTLAMLVLVDPSQTDGERIERGLERVGRWGYGRDASTGKGRFTIESRRQVELPPAADGDACYTLAPCVPEAGAFDPAHFVPFVRFGKHGDRLAQGGNPFKNPVIMADDAAVFRPKNPVTFERPYIGRAVSGVSKSLPETRVQGYAPYLPLKMES
jgi:CRISPR-associated protein Csm4